MTDGLEMDFNMPVLQGAEQAQSPEVVLRERMHQLSKNSVRELLSPSLGLCSCPCDLHGQFSQLHVQTGFRCKFYMQKTVLCSAMLLTAQTEREQAGALGDVKERSFAVPSLSLTFLSCHGKRFQQQVRGW